MRLVLAGLFLPLALASGDGSDAVGRFEQAYARATTPANRREAILDLAREGSAPALDQLVKLWDKLADDAMADRQGLAECRAKVRDLRTKAHGAKKPDSLSEAIAKLDAEAEEISGRLVARESDQAAVLEGVRGQAEADALDWLAEEGLRRARSPALVAAIAQRIAMARPSGAQAVLLALETAPRAEMIVPLLSVLARYPQALKPGIPTLLKLLRHRDWAVRIAAARALARSALPEAVEPLLDALHREKGETRAQQEMGRALTILTGANLGGDVDLWDRWWRDHGAEVASGKLELGKGVPGGEGRDADSRFYGIEQEEKRIIYVFDKSGSMEVSMENPRWVNNQAVPARDDEDSRFDAARRELLRAAKSLRKGSEFAVVLYSDRVEPIHDRLLQATPENYAKFATEMGRRGPEGSTNIYEALDFALRMANVHAEQTKGEQRADAIILVSDGSPTNSKGEPEDPERTLAAVREWNAGKRIVIHTIGIGAEHSEGFMRTLAEENGGTYYAVRPAKK